MSLYTEASKVIKIKGLGEFVLRYFVFEDMLKIEACKLNVISKEKVLKVNESMSKRKVFFEKTYYDFNKSSILQNNTDDFVEDLKFAIRKQKEIEDDKNIFEILVSSLKSEY